jgi:hypothetical protein
MFHVVISVLNDQGSDDMHLPNVPLASDIFRSSGFLIKLNRCTVD